MNETAVDDRAIWHRPRPGLSAILGASAIVAFGFHLQLAMGGEDLDPYESPLILSAARQLVSGPWGLYGPYGGSDPLVLIHAPLYYRATGLLAWPLYRAGVHPLVAAQLAGRLVSALGLLATMGAAYRLGRLGGLPRRAGLWAALLVAGSPVLAGQPVAVRPDMLGVALQSWGMAVALGSIGGSGRRPILASVLFGLAVCVKQSLVAAWAVSAALACRRSPGTVWRLILPGAAVSGLIIAAEWWATAGGVWESTFAAAAHVPRIHPGGLIHVATVSAAMLGKGAGLAAMVAAGAAARRPQARGWSGAAATVVVVAIAASTLGQLVLARAWLTAMLPIAALLGLGFGLAGLVPGSPGRDEAVRIDAALLAYFGAEVVLTSVLCASSSGAWINYGIGATVVLAVLAGRSLAAEGVPARLARFLSTIAAMAVLASVLMDAKVELNRRRIEREGLRRMSSAVGLPPSAYYFADRPGLNRMSGRLEWVYDDWLYPVFESRKLAEPRARWLRPRLGPRGGMRAVVLESDATRLDGIPEALPGLGYRPAGRFGPFRVWVLGPPPGGAP